MNKKALGKSSGFLFSLEALCSIMLLLISISFLPAFRAHSGGEEDFFLCADAAGIAIKSSQNESELIANLQAAGKLSGMCLSLAYGEKEEITCTGGKESRGETTSFTFPLHTGGKTSIATISCWHSG